MTELAAGRSASFEVCAELPAGTTVLEASAGTGKTYTIAALATRYVAEGLATLDQLMLVTFSRSATQELRERVRGRLTSAALGLADPVAARAGEDEIVALLARAGDAEVDVRRRRLATALAAFDGATIATTHQFCQQVLRGLGVAGDVELDAQVVENLDDLVVEVVDDLYLRRYGAPGSEPPLITRTQAIAVARAATADVHAQLEPSGAARDTVAGARRALAEAVRREFDVRKRARRLLGYDDLLSRLADALGDATGGPPACDRLRRRYRVVLVDEFQDTDPVQWDILRLAFHLHTTLVLIGDPKQAIYAFRGADVVTYLTAADAAQTNATLSVNWRSDQPLLRAFDAVFAGAALGDPRIVVRPVSSAHPGQRIVAEEPVASLRLRLVPRHLLSLTTKGLAATGHARSVVARDLAADLVGLLDGRTRLLVTPALSERGPMRNPVDPSGVPPGSPVERPVCPGDVAVIVRTNKQAELIRDALRQANVPAVLGGGPSVFVTRTAREWLVLLEALEAPHRSPRVRAAALTCFLGWTAERLAAAQAAAVDELGTLMRRWAVLLAERGVAALLEAAFVSQRIPERLLGYVDGERQLTDLRHVGEALHRIALDGQLGLSALAEWLRHRICEAGADADEERTRRLESDADAVQVITVHRSKGLEFPVVYLPFAWDRWVPQDPDPLLLHDELGVRVRDVGGPTDPGWARRAEQHRLEESGEDLRLLYVGLTRAQSHVVAWWAPSTNTPSSALHRLLFGTFEPEQKPPDVVPVPSSDAAALERLREVAHRSTGSLTVHEVGHVDPVTWHGTDGQVPSMRTAVFDRQVDVAWRRTSYSSLTTAVHQLHTAVTSEPEDVERDDERETPTPEDSGRRPPDDVMSPMAALPAGTSFGTLVHAVLENVDTQAADLSAELQARVTEQLSYRPMAGVAVSELSAALLPSLETPLGDVGLGRTLRDIAPRDRLAELDFELPLAGGDEPHADVVLADVAGLLRRHLPSDDPLAGYPDLLDDALLRGQHLRGFLTGSIDAVLRIRHEGEPRYVIVDYKTNWLGAPGGPLGAWDYRPSAMAAAMCEAHYPLQALLYSVALHRYLRWRDPRYVPELHLGGAAYLFLRGMCGAGSPAFDGMTSGVFGWRPAPVMVTELSTLLDEGAR